MMSRRSFRQKKETVFCGGSQSACVMKMFSVSSKNRGLSCIFRNQTFSLFLSFCCCCWFSLKSSKISRISKVSFSLSSCLFCLFLILRSFFLSTPSRGLFFIRIKFHQSLHSIHITVLKKKKNTKEDDGDDDGESEFWLQR